MQQSKLNQRQNSNLEAHFVGAVACSSPKRSIERSITFVTLNVGLLRNIIIALSSDLGQAGRHLPLHQFCLSLLLLASFACNKSSGPANQNTTQPSNATGNSIGAVNGRLLSVKVYEWKLKSGCEALGLDPEKSAGNPEFEELREAVVSNLIDGALTVQEAEKRSLAVAPEKLAEAETKEIKTIGGEQAFDAYLTKYNLSRDEYREIIKNELAREVLRDDLSKDLVFTSEEIKAYYDAHANELGASPEKKDRPTLVQATPEITRRLREEKGKKLLDEWLKAARKTADVKLNESYRFGKLKREFPS
jgi:hypothetical protein